MRCLPLFLLPALLALSACAEQWEKPGATARDFDAMQAACVSHASQKFPPLMRPIEVGQGYVTPAVTHCERNPYAVNCYQQGGTYVPPLLVDIDDNQDGRDADIRACLYANGWHPKE
ncbi:MAG: hypothetical protein M3N08_09150 [Pseudomonadota bacterium]|nr:hypothetical protein [Pseudomonadota bacterium]